MTFHRNDVSSNDVSSKIKITQKPQKWHIAIELRIVQKKKNNDNVPFTLTVQCNVYICLNNCGDERNVPSIVRPHTKIRNSSKSLSMDFSRARMIYLVNNSGRNRPHTKIRNSSKPLSNGLAPCARMMVSSIASLLSRACLDRLYTKIRKSSKPLSNHCKIKSPATSKSSFLKEFSLA